jgi:hypothetical protein
MADKPLGLASQSVMPLTEAVMTAADNDADSFNRIGAVGFLCSRGAWTTHYHLDKAARRGGSPAFTENEAGEPICARDVLVAHATQERQRIARQRAVRSALAATRHKRP